jgi:ABC-type branched-subunit amino acid transport system ATPase component
MTTFAVTQWQPLDLWLDEIGPFRQGLEHMELFGLDENGRVTPATMYMLLAPNGKGKTTALNAIYGLFGLLSEPAVGRFLDPAETGRAQLDVRATIAIDGVERTYLLSIWIGTETPLRSWTDEEVREHAEAEAWAKLGLGAAGGRGVALTSSDDVGASLLQAVHRQRNQQPTELLGLSQDLPTVLLFPADRTIVAPTDERVIRRPDNFGYQPAQKFGSDGHDWGSSIDNLLVWLEWLDDGRIEDLIGFLNRNLFRDEKAKVIRRPMRRELMTYVETSTGIHPLSGLSQGERALLQFYVRVRAHMTRNTIILVDEVENHLHPRWMQRMVAALKTIAREPSLNVTVVFTTHNMELMESFRHDQPEKGLVKGGYMIEQEMN